MTEVKRLVFADLKAVRDRINAPQVQPPTEQPTLFE
jgi:hypothetical protein